MLVTKTKKTALNIFSFPATNPRVLCSLAPARCALHRAARGRGSARRERGRRSVALAQHHEWLGDIFKRRGRRGVGDGGEEDPAHSWGWCEDSCKARHQIFYILFVGSDPPAVVLSAHINV